MLLQMASGIQLLLGREALYICRELKEALMENGPTAPLLPAGIRGVNLFSATGEYSLLSMPFFSFPDFR